MLMSLLMINTSITFDSNGRLITVLSGNTNSIVGSMSVGGKAASKIVQMDTHPYLLI